MPIFLYLGFWKKKYHLCNLNQTFYVSNFEPVDFKSDICF